MAAPMVELVIKWAGKEYKISDLSENQTVGDLKKRIQTDTNVLPERQKLLGLKLKGIVRVFYINPYFIAHAQNKQNFD